MESIERLHGTLCLIFMERIPTGKELKNAEEIIYLTEQSIKELKEGKTIFEDGGRILIIPPKKRFRE